ncbi:hypothetical protein I7X12_12430 [Halosimplex litoreum]|uniref:Histidine kinase-, DNA gyrase B-, and HSP90-like ATPase n=2 Tax=Halosimplex litoreum TaxID=1198301 RepID=A0A7T3FW38_9EURY|nr:hypothetical protein I7X12_12430 [Halosimplex litoreum]
MNTGREHLNDDTEWFFFSGGPGSPRYGDDPTKHAVDHDTESFVREVLQNANDQGLDNGEPVEVTFRFLTLTGEERDRFLETLEWNNGLQDRLDAVAQTDRGRGYDRLLDRMGDPDAELRLLVVEDSNTTGLTGGWDQDSNYAALVRDELYSSKREDNAGGSYGLGKSVLWTFSGASTVIFNSQLPPGSDDGESPRLIARTKLPTHELPGDDTTYQGAGWFCRPQHTDDGVRPEALRGDEASRLAQRLQIDRPAVSGTSAMVVEYRDPTRDVRPEIDELADEFVEASVKYFWPAIYRGDLRVTVETPEETREADVDNVPSIRPFVESYEARFEEGTTLQNPGDVAGLDIPVDLPPRSDGTETPDGEVRLSSRLASPADDDTYLNRVALFRGAGMVVKYYDQNRVAFGDRNFYGVLACGEARADGPATESDQEVDRFLRFSEPPEHDEWESTENLREQYQRGFRTALDDMFGTLRDGLRHLISKNDSGRDALSDSVLNHFPIHGTGAPRTVSTSDLGRIFEIDSSSRFDGDRWVFSGHITSNVDDFESWTAEISMMGVGEDGTRYDDVPIESISTDSEGVETTTEDGTVRLIADETSKEVTFEGHSRTKSESNLLSGEVGETQLEVRAELETTEGDQA